MADYTKVMITAWINDKGAIKYINDKTGLNLKKISDDRIIFRVYGDTPRSIKQKRIDQLIEAFQEAPFERKEVAILFIDDSTQDYYEVIRHGYRPWK
jgi:hypothetical protein